MAKSKVTAADRSGGTTTVEMTAFCESGRHAKCRGELFSLFAAPGARCACHCHALPIPQAWKGEAA